MKRVLILASFLGLTVSIAMAEQPMDSRRQDFAAEPKWDGYRNRLVTDPAPITRQKFGWSDTSHAGGKEKGEIGGRVQRSTTPASYATVISEKTLNDHIEASGRFSVTQDDGGSTLLFGFFNENSRGWRTNNSLFLRLDGNSNGYIVFYEYGTQHHLAHGGGAFEGKRWQTTKTPAKKPDGTSHTWTLRYDPDAADGKGQISLTLDGEEFELPLLEGHKADGAAFNRFGILNAQTTGAGMTAWFDDLQVDGKTIDLSTDPKWEAQGNDAQFADRVKRPLQDFGFSPETQFAGGKAVGEIGGIVWRDESPAYYGDRVGPLDLNRELVASGTLAFCKAGSDSGVWFGWFDSASRKASAAGTNESGKQTNYLGIRIEGPSRVGHYFRPGYRTSEGKGMAAEKGPLIRPDGKVHRWRLHYRPDAANGKGQIEVRFDEQTQTIDLRPGDRARGATFDRFGIFSASPGGHHTEIYLDDLSYTHGGH